MTITIVSQDRKHRSVISNAKHLLVRMDSDSRFSVIYTKHINPDEPSSVVLGTYSSKERANDLVKLIDDFLKRIYVHIKLAINNSTMRVPLEKDGEKIFYMPSDGRKQENTSSSGVILLEYPERCADCPLVNFVDITWPICSYTGENLTGDNYFDKKSELCPISKIPNEYVVKKDSGQNDWQLGWNACIDAITKEKK